MKLCKNCGHRINAHDCLASNPVQWKCSHPGCDCKKPEDGAKTVWLVEFEVEYEPGQIIGIGATEAVGLRIADKYIGESKDKWKDHETEKNTFVRVGGGSEAKITVAEVEVQE